MDGAVIAGYIGRLFLIIGQFPEFVGVILEDCSHRLTFFGIEPERNALHRVVI